MRCFCSILLMMLIWPCFAQKQGVPAKVSLSEQEMEIVKQIYNYRERNGLDLVPVSVSLTFVAQTHALDLKENHSDNDSCNLHSWSGKGEWTSCCYTQDHAKASCMWDKPRELTTYSGDGFEIAFYSTKTYKNKTDQAADALANWKHSAGHNSVILNQNIWSKMKWKAMGVGVCQGYTVVWFGMQPDPAGNIKY
jgi:uncharacterized protein YkwD